MIEYTELKPPITDHKIHSRKQILCAVCDKPLLDLIITTTEQNRINHYRCQCPCGNHSFTEEVIGFANFSPIVPLQIVKVETNNNLTIIKVR